MTRFCTTTTERFYMNFALSLHIITVSAAYHEYGRLRPIERKPHRSYPICCAREWPRDRWWDRPKGEEYPWCPVAARWNFNEMDVCPEHAAQMALGIMVVGVPLDGRWKR